MTKLQKLFERFDTCSLCESSSNKLQHILGGGKTKAPEVAMVLINPTHQNLSSRPGYKGRRFPFVGVARFWKILFNSGWIKTDTNDPEEIFEELVRNNIYLTNLIKCTFNHGNYPPKEVFDYHLPLFKKELDIIKPRNIVTFGALPTKLLTGRNIKLKDYFKNPYQLFYESTPVHPCYFPVGRGNSKLATKVLKSLKFLIE